MTTEYGDEQPVPETEWASMTGGGPLDGQQVPVNKGSRELHVEGGSYYRTETTTLEWDDDYRQYRQMPIFECRREYAPQRPSPPPPPPNTDAPMPFMPGPEPEDQDDGVLKEAVAYDRVTQPAHYNAGAVETIDLNENASANLAAAFKYLDRADRKPGETLERAMGSARWYLLREFLRQGWITLEQWERAVGRRPAGSTDHHQV